MITNLPVKNLFNINGSGDQCNHSFNNNGFPPECWDLLHRLFINVFNFFFSFHSFAHYMGSAFFSEKNFPKCKSDCLHSSHWVWLLPKD